MKSRLVLLFTSAALMFTMNIYSQGVSINDNGAAPAVSAMLDIQSDSKGLLMPRLDFIEMFTMESPATGLIVYNTTFNKFYYFDGTGWERITGGADNSWSAADANIYSNNTGNVGIGTEEPSHKLTLQNEYGSEVLRLIGPGSYGHLGKINFGDGNYAYISEYADDKIAVYASGGMLLTSPYGGVKISGTSAASHPSAMLDVSSSDKGLLIPRLTKEQITAIDTPADGLQVYNTDNGSLYIFVELHGMWKEVSFGSGIIAPPFQECGDVFTDDRDDQLYPTVDINGQCWMSKNMNIGTVSNYQNNNGVIEKYCWGGSSTNCDTYGGLYKWDEMMKYNTLEGGQGICPDGWHIPSDAEIYAMENFVDPVVNNPNATGWRGNNVGGELKATGYTYWNGPNTGATNNTGFNKLGAGYRTSSGYAYYLKQSAGMWSSTLSGYSAYYREFNYSNDMVWRNNIDKNYYFSVRCLKDEN